MFTIKIWQTIEPFSSQTVRK